MSSFVRKITMRLMDQLNVDRDKGRPVRRSDGKITHFAYPLAFPVDQRPAKGSGRQKPVARGRRRGKRNKAYIARRKAVAS